MEKEKNKSIIIVIVSIVIILLVVALVFLLTGIINFKGKENNIVDTNQNNVIDDELLDEIECDDVLCLHVDSDSCKSFDKVEYIKDDIAKKIIEDLFWNSDVRFMLDAHYNVCDTDDNANFVEWQDLGLEYDEALGHEYYKCPSNFKSYNDIVSYFKKYVTDELWTSIIKQNIHLAEKKNEIGYVFYNYYVKDGVLYGAGSHSGDVGLKANPIKSKSVFNIVSHTNDTIVADLIGYWSFEGEYSEDIRIVLKNVNNVWKIDNYKVLCEHYPESNE